MNYSISFHLKINERLLANEREKHWRLLRLDIKQLTDLRLRFDIKRHDIIINSIYISLQMRVYIKMH